jgi:axial budding pattern protein 2
MVANALVVLALAFIWTVSAAPVPNYPVNAQLPPVARVGTNFNFTFAESTFVDGGAGLTYSLANAPKWLRLDSASRSLHGTPDSGDVGATSFNLIATDQSGSAQMSVTVVTSKNAGPKPGESLLAQLAEFGPTSSPATIFVYPERSFSLRFGTNTFTNTDSSTMFYATSSYNSPLPSWIAFNPSQLMFDGTTPTSPSSQPQSFSLNLVASDVAGFSAATVSFDIVVGQHLLAFKNSTLPFNFTRGQPFSTPPLIDSLALDGRQPTIPEITSISIDKPSWLSAENRTLSFSGTAPKDAPPQNVTVTVTDIYDDTTTLLIDLQLSQLFSEGLQGFYATTGEEFSYRLDTSLLSNPSARLTVDLGSISSWASYDANTMTIQGHVPADIEPQTFSIQLVASEGSVTESRNLDLRVFAKGQGGNTNNKSEAVAGKDNFHLHRAGMIAIATVVPLAIFLGLAFIVCCCYRRRRSRATKAIGDQEKSPVPPADGEEGSSSSFCEEDTCEVSEHRRSSITFSLPPRLELEPLWETDSEEANETANTDKSSKEERQKTHSNLVWSLDKNLIDASQVQEPARETRPLSQLSSPLSRTSTRRSTKKREPLKPIQQQRTFKRDSAMSAKSKRYSKRSSGISSVAVGLPVRLSGAGHGAGCIGSPAHAAWRSSWQTTQMSFSGDENEIDTLAPLFPRPPQARARNSISTRPRDSRRISLMQPIEAALFGQPDTDSLETFIQERARNRNSDNPLFRARVSSRESTGVRALEKARRESSIAETVTSNSPAVDDTQQSLQVRPMSTARSSVYTDDFRISTQIRTFSQTSNTNELNVPRMRGSRLVQRYTDAISQLPRFWSQGSLASSRHFESANSMANTDDSNDVGDEQPPLPSRDFSGHRVRRMSSLPNSVSSPPPPTGDVQWGSLCKSDERQPVSTVETGFPSQAMMSSISGDLAFV